MAHSAEIFADFSGIFARQNSKRGKKFGAVAQGVQPYSPQWHKAWKDLTSRKKGAKPELLRNPLDKKNLMLQYCPCYKSLVVGLMRIFLYM
jgi:hypothetical protein